MTMLDMFGKKEYNDGTVKVNITPISVSSAAKESDSLTSLTPGYTGFARRDDGTSFISKAFDVVSSYVKGENHPIGSYINGNASVTIYSDGTKVRVFPDGEFKPKFAENIDIKLTDRCSGGCPYCHEGSTPSGNGIDTIPGFMFDLHPFQEVALGGGNILELDNPTLINILNNLADKNVITNATVNQIHFVKEYDKLYVLCRQNILHGVGVSLMEPTNKLIYLARKTPNVVIHVIAGIVTKEQLEAMKDMGLKLLILGYKNLRRGEGYYSTNSEKIDSNIKWLSDNILGIKDWFDVVSFDNLAIEQLGLRSKIDEATWNSRYMGDDGTSTFYVDCVKKQFSKSSTTPIDKRFNVLPEDGSHVMKVGTPSGGVRTTSACDPEPFWYDMSYRIDRMPKCDMHWPMPDSMFDLVRERENEK